MHNLKYRTLVSTPINRYLLELIRSKRELHWRPSLEELRRGFLGWHQRGYLPHFDGPNVTQMVTWMLADSFPATRRMEWEPILQEPDHSIRRRKLEAWLDRGHGKCWLRLPRIAEIVEDALLDAEKRDFQLVAWVIMPNHVHLVVNVWNVPLRKLVARWKGSSSRFANLELKRTSSFWQEDYFDTLIRDEEHLRKVVHYVEANPAKACLVKDQRVGDGVVPQDEMSGEGCSSKASRSAAFTPLRMRVLGVWEPAMRQRVQGEAVQAQQQSHAKRRKRRAPLLVLRAG